MLSPFDEELTPPQGDRGIEQVFQRIGDTIPQAINTAPVKIRNQAFFM